MVFIINISWLISAINIINVKEELFFQQCVEINNRNKYQELIPWSNDVILIIINNFIINNDLISLLIAS